MLLVGSVDDDVPLTSAGEDTDCVGVLLEDPAVRQRLRGRDGARSSECQ